MNLSKFWKTLSPWAKIMVSLILITIIGSILISAVITALIISPILFILNLIFGLFGISLITFVTNSGTTLLIIALVLGLLVYLWRKK